MKLPQSFQEIATRVARHEAGHYVVARALGFRVGGLSITFTDFLGGYRAGSEITLPTSLSSVSDISGYLRRRVKVLYAGVLAEAMSAGEIDRDKALEYIRKGGADDHSKVRELINAIRSIEYGATKTDEEAQSQLDVLDCELWNASADLVKAESATIVGLGSRLASEVREIGKAYKISKAELESLPALVKRFGIATKQPNNASGGSNAHQFEC